MAEESDEVKTHSDGYWETFYSSEKPDYEIKGKYLLFSMDREKLVRIAEQEIKNGPFHQAKTQMPGLNDSLPGTGEEYVLCLYYKDDSRKHELADKYQSQDGVRYRYWKSDEATRKGKYSEEFLEDMPQNLKYRFTSDDADDDSSNLD